MHARFITLATFATLAVACGGSGSETYVPSFFGIPEKQALSDNVSRYCFSRSDWKTMDAAERESLNREFNAMAEAAFSSSEDESDQRVYKTMLELWQKAELSSIGAKI